MKDSRLSEYSNLQHGNPIIQKIPAMRSMIGRSNSISCSPFKEVVSENSRIQFGQSSPSGFRQQAFIKSQNSTVQSPTGLKEKLVFRSRNMNQSISFNRSFSKQIPQIRPKEHQMKHWSQFRNLVHLIKLFFDPQIRICHPKILYNNKRIN